jgi:membrane-bound lytic murein transglycosylase A
MKPSAASILLVALVAGGLAGCKSKPDYNRPLPEGWPALLPVTPEERPDFAADWPALKSELLPALERSIEWTRKEYAEQFFPIEGVTHERALASLERFREILEVAQDARDLGLALASEFDVYKSAGWDGKGGGVLFTGYCTPILAGNLERSETYAYPLYALPEDLVKGPDGAILGQQTAEGLAPYPTRRAIEASGMLDGRGLELVWLRDPLDAFIAHVNGSAFIELPDGEQIAFGYAGKNGREYTSLGKELVKEKKLTASELSLARIREWAREHPGEVVEYLHRNDSFVFFTPITGNPHGSLNVEVTGGRTLATDKALFPRGALTFVEAELPDGRGAQEPFERFLLDQDTGGAIRTAGRGDLYIGVGPQAERRAGSTQSEGQLYYLFLKPERVALMEMAP